MQTRTASSFATAELTSCADVMNHGTRQGPAPPNLQACCQSLSFLVYPLYCLSHLLFCDVTIAIFIKKSERRMLRHIVS